MRDLGRSDKARYDPVVGTKMLFVILWQGTAFMSRTIRKLYELLGIKSVRTSVYHPQTDGLVERFNRTLKTMIRKFIHEDAKNVDK